MIAQNIIQQAATETGTPLEIYEGDTYFCTQDELGEWLNRRFALKLGNQPADKTALAMHTEGDIVFLVAFIGGQDGGYLSWWGHVKDKEKILWEIQDSPMFDDSPFELRDI